MRTLAKSRFALIIAALAVGRLSSQSTSPSPSHSVTPEEYERWKKDLSNWGRWGKDDQIGALNLITPSKRKQAASLVKEGVSLSLASNAATMKAVDVPCPVE